jgi:hypothetical protein
MRHGHVQFEHLGPDALENPLEVGPIRDGHVGQHTNDGHEFCRTVGISRFSTGLRERHVNLSPVVGIDLGFDEWVWRWPSEASDDARHLRDRHADGSLKVTDVHGLHLCQELEREDLLLVQVPLLQVFVVLCANPTQHHELEDLFCHLLDLSGIRFTWQGTKSFLKNSVSKVYCNDLKALVNGDSCPCDRDFAFVHKKNACRPADTNAGANASARGANTGAFAEATVAAEAASAESVTAEPASAEVAEAGVAN